MTHSVRQSLRNLASIVMLGAVAACSMSLPQATAGGAAPTLGTRPNVGLNPLHNFGRGNDGYAPEAGLLYYNHRFYGTTKYGGSGGNGTVFAISDLGIEKVIYDFRRLPDGSEPVASLIEIKGQVYGTTEGGGKYRQGTVFSIDPVAGKENWSYSFGAGGDGSMPVANLTAVGEKLYGTTEKGGAYGEGTVFSIALSDPRKDTILHSFGYGNDGMLPTGGLLAFDNMLYGTTTGGGGPPSKSYGTVYRIALSGSEKVVLAFNCGDGMAPAAALVRMGDTLYGTTSLGGTLGCSSGGNGTVFALSTGGNEHVVHGFADSTADGNDPLDTLIAQQGRLYGTAYNGGANSGGIIFDLTPAGLETILHSFGEGTDGNHPVGGVIHVGNAFYGTTSGGGVNGGGIVYRLTI